MQKQDFFIKIAGRERSASKLPTHTAPVAMTYHEDITRLWLSMFGREDLLTIS